MTANLNKMGVKAVDAMFNSGGDTPTPHQVDLQTRKEDKTGSEQLFPAQLKSFVTGSQSFTFQIHVTGIIDSSTDG